MAAPQTEVPETMQQGGTCHFFSIPPELRNEIYELAYAIQYANPISFMRVEPPSKSLPLVCKQMYHEAGGIYCCAYRRFWAENTFSIRQPPETGNCTLDDCAESLEVMHSTFDKRKDEDVASITRFCIFVGNGTKYQKAYELRDGAWDKCWNFDGGKEYIRSFVLLPETEHQNVELGTRDQDFECMRYCGTRCLVSDCKWSAETRTRAVRLAKRASLTKFELMCILKLFW